MMPTDLGEIVDNNPLDPRFWGILRLFGIGVTTIEAIREGMDRAFSRAWFKRGLADAVHHVGLPLAHNFEVALYSGGFERGAEAALRLAAAVVSDPGVRGREHEALRLLAEGLDHAAIRAKLARPAVDADMRGSNIIPIAIRDPK